MSQRLHPVDTNRLARGTEQAVARHTSFTMKIPFAGRSQNLYSDRKKLSNSCFWPSGSRLKFSITQVASEAAPAVGRRTRKVKEKIRTAGLKTRSIAEPAADLRYPKPA